MRLKDIHPAVKVTFLVVVFLFAAAVLLLTAGRPLTGYLRTVTETAVEMGAPVYEYSDGEDQPEDGTIRKSEVAVPATGSRYGTIICDDIGLKAPLYYGDTDKILSRGAGQYTGSGLPGEGRIILVGAHDVGYFEVLENAKKGQEINVRTSYGDFVYRITDLRVEDVSYISTRDLQKADGEKLVLYTCYPFGEVFDKSDRRYFVTAEKVSGPVLVEDQQ